MADRDRGGRGAAGDRVSGAGLLVTPPATAVTAEIEPLLAGCDPAVVAHSRRSYQFAAGLVQADDVALDAEVLYLGTILHDVGLATASDGAERFEVRGANLVRELLLDHGFLPVRVGMVWDVIALHASTPLARHKSAETRYANRGIALDVRGVGSEALPPAFVRAVLDRWPRTTFPADFERVLATEVLAHPETVRMSWLESVAAAHVPGFTPTDFLAGLHASADFV